MEKIVRQALLYDFYGELLTDHQKKVYEDVVMEDLSYSEIARISNISRQGAYDMVKRCDKILEDYEDKLHLVKRFMEAKKQLTEVEETAGKLKEKLKTLETEGMIPKDQRTVEMVDEILKSSRKIQEEF